MDVNERINALLTERARLWNDSTGWLDEVTKENRGEPMNAEQRAEWQRRNERIDALKEEADELAAAEERNRTAEGVRAAHAVVFGTDPESDTEVVRANRNIVAWLRGDIENRMTNDEGQVVNAYQSRVSVVQRERELIRLGASPDEVRALAWDTGSSASAVPTLFDRRLYEVMEANIAAMRLPTTRITSDSGAPMQFPKVTAHAIATQVAGQGTALAGTDPTFDRLTLTPVKHGELIKLSSEVVSDTGVDIVGFVTRDLGRAVARQVNLAVMTVLNASAFVGAGGTVATGGTLITPTYEKMVDMEFSINDAYRSATSTAWLMKDSTAGLLRKLRDGAGGTEGSPMWQPSLQGGISGLRTPDRFFGYPVFTDPNIAASASAAKIIAFGDWTGFYLRTVGDVMVERNDSRFFDTDEIAYRGKARVASGAQDLTAINWMRQSVA